MSRSHIEALTAVLFMGTVPIAVKSVGANEWVIGLLRLSIAIACTLLLLRNSRDLFGRPAKELGVLALMGFIFSLHWSTYFVGIKQTTASAAAIGAATYGVHVSLLGCFLLRQWPNAWQWLSLIIAMAGTFLVIERFSFSDMTTTGFLITIGSAFINAFLPILHQRHVAIPVNVRTLGQYLFALPLFLCFLPQMNWELTRNDWLGLIHLGILATFVAHTLWIRAASVLPTHQSGLIFYLYVPLTMMFSVIWFQESISWTKILGAMLIVAASCLGVMSQGQSSSPRPEKGSS